MQKTDHIALTKNNLVEIKNILSNFPKSGFLRFCIINKIVENGIKKFKQEQLKQLNN